MSFFQPTFFPDGSFTVHQPIQPPPEPQFQARARAALTPAQDDTHDQLQLASLSERPGLAHPRPCVPPHGPCPAPIPPESASSSVDQLQTQDQMQLQQPLHGQNRYDRIVNIDPTDAHSSLDISIEASPAHSQQFAASRASSVTHSRSSSSRHTTHYSHPHSHHLSSSLTHHALDGSDETRSPTHALPRHSHSTNQGLPLPITQNRSQPFATPAAIPIPQTPSPAYEIALRSPAPQQNSPPGYKPLPSSSEGTLLLAPPPSFYASTCPYSYSSCTARPANWDHASALEAGSGSGEGGEPLHQHSCPHCFFRSRALRGLASNPGYGEDSTKVDLMVALLAILNVIVWSAVLWGYYCEFTGHDFPFGGGVRPAPGRGRGGWTELASTGCVGPQGAGGWGRICNGEDCR